MSEERRTIWSFIRPEFSVGSAVNTLIAAGILGWVITSSSTMATLSERLQDFQITVNAQLAAMHAVIDGLPAQTVIINDMQTHLHAIDARLDTLEERLRTIELNQRTDEVNLQDIQRAVAGKYPPP